MPPKSKYALGEYQQNANKVFTNRENFISLFEASKKSLRKEKHSLVTFYGVGGEGKSALCRKLINTLHEEKPRTSSCGFVDFAVQTHRRADRALLEFRKSLRNSSNGKIKFPAFEIAIIHYWEKEYPELNVHDSLKDIFDKNEDTIASVADNVKDWGEYARDLPAGLADNLKDWSLYAQDLPAGLGLGIKVLNYLRNKSQEAYYKSIKESLKDIEKLNSHELLRKLPYIFATDILAYIARESSSNTVLFIDTYEGLWEHNQVKTGIGTSETDSWIRDLISELPGVLFVIMGREKLTWDKDFPDEWEGYLDNQYQLNGLKDEDADRFLRLIPIHVDTIRAAIVQGAKGDTNDQLTPGHNGAHPFYLELAADLYLGLLDEGKVAEAEDIGKTPRELLERFIRYRSREEIETLKVLSVAHSFDRPLFETLVTHFQTNYPLTSFPDFVRYSFINQGQDGRYYIHALMREHLSLALEPSTFRVIRDNLFNYYNSLLPKNSKEVNTDHEFHLQEAFKYLNWTNPVTALNWYDDQYRLFYEAAKYALLIPLALNVLHYSESKQPVDNHLLAIDLDNLARLYQGMGQYKEAEPLYKRALEIRRKNAESAEATDLIRSHLAAGFNNLALLYEKLNRYEEALPMYKDALDIYKKHLPNHHHSIANILNNVAEVLNNTGKFEQAGVYYLESLSLYRKCLPPDHPHIASVLCNVATLYRRVGMYQESEMLHIESLAIRERSRSPDHPEVANSLHNLSFLYIVQERYSQAEPLLLRAIAIRQNTLRSDHPDLVESLKCLEILKSRTYRES